MIHASRSVLKSRFSCTVKLEYAKNGGPTFQHISQRPPLLTPISSRSYSVAVITPDSDSGNPGSIPGMTYHVLFCLLHHHYFATEILFLDSLSCFPSLSFENPSL